MLGMYEQRTTHKIEILLITSSYHILFILLLCSTGLDSKQLEYLNQTPQESFENSYWYLQYCS